MTCVSSMSEAGHPKPVLLDNPEGWREREVGGGFRIGGGKCITYGRFMLMYGRNHPNIVIIQLN